MPATANCSKGLTGSHFFFLNEGYEDWICAHCGVEGEQCDLCGGSGLNPDARRVYADCSKCGGEGVVPVEDKQEVP